MNANSLAKAFAAMGLACVVLAVSCKGPSPCGETVSHSAISPDGTTSAKVSIVNCGATTDFITFVNLDTSRIKIRDGGLLFAYTGKADVQVIWSGDRSLKIVCLECSKNRVYRAVQKEEQYEISYSIGQSS